jgi:hydroxymethylbilane synthase
VTSFVPLPPSFDQSSPIRIGTRGSALALTQANLVVDLLAARDLLSEIVIVRTQGDADQTSPLALIGGQGVFTSALQDALLRDEIDVAVHAAKDLPTSQHPELELAAFLSRQDPRDVLISKADLDLNSLPIGARVGTSSRRRVAQLLAVRSDLDLVDLRGNIDTRIRRATNGDLDAVILAAAGLVRMGWQDRITSYLPLDQFVPAPGQAALALEIRRGKAGLAQRVAELDEPHVSISVRAERAFLRAIGAGCTTPVGAYATVVDGQVRLSAMVASPELTESRSGLYDLAADDAEEAAGRVARELVGLVRRDRRSRRRPLLDGLDRPTVLVTRPGRAGKQLAAGVVRAGAMAIVEPMLLIEPTRSPVAADALRRGAAGQFDWVAFTSANAVDGLLSNLEDGLDLPVALGGTRVVAIGDVTAASLRAAGIEPALVAVRSDVQGLAEAMAVAGVGGTTVWLPQGNLASDELAVALRRAGATVSVTPVYRVDQPREVSPATRAALLQGDVDAVLFASPSAVRHLVGLLGPDWSTLDDVLIVAIGETTAAEIRRFDLDVSAVAGTPSDHGLIGALQQAMAERDDDLAPNAPGSPSRQAGITP